MDDSDFIIRLTLVGVIMLETAESPASRSWDNTMFVSSQAVR